MRRPCIETGCTQLAQPGGSRCRGHQQTRTAHKNRARRNRAHPSRGPAAQLRQTLNTRGWGICSNCHQPHPARHLQVDHTRPLADGGGDTPANLQVLCRECHGHKTATENANRNKRNN